MGRLPGGKNRPKQPADGAAVMAPPAVDPVRQQIKDFSGFSNLDQLKDSLPETMAAVEIKSRKPRAPKVEEISDPYYEKCIANMTGGGGQRIVKSGFKAAALITEKPEVDLNADEEEQWKQYFYVVGKKAKLDPENPWVLASFGVGLLLENVLVRLWKLNSESFTSSFMKLFGMSKDEDEPEVKGKEEPSGEVDE